MKIQNNNINFGIHQRNVTNQYGKLKYRTNTCFFRGDLEWDKFVKLIDKKFENQEKVTITNIACSDGEETFSLVYKLLEILKEKEEVVNE